MKVLSNLYNHAALIWYEQVQGGNDNVEYLEPLTIVITYVGMIVSG